MIGGGSNFHLSMVRPTGSLAKCDWMGGARETMLLPFYLSSWFFLPKLRGGRMALDKMK